MEAMLMSFLGSVPLRDEALTIGRSPNNRLFISNATVSRHHAEVRPLGSGYAIVDLASTSGTFVNGERLVPQTPHTLCSGDMIQIGSFSLAYEEKSPVLSIDAMATIPITHSSVAGQSLPEAVEQSGADVDKLSARTPEQPGAGAYKLPVASRPALNEALIAPDEAEQARLHSTPPAPLVAPVVSLPARSSPGAPEQVAAMDTLDLRSLIRSAAEPQVAAEEDEVHPQASIPPVEQSAPPSEEESEPQVAVQADSPVLLVEPAPSNEAEERDATPALDELREHTVNLAENQLRFTAFYPRNVAVEDRRALLVYAHIEEALDAVRADAQRLKDLLAANPGKSETSVEESLADATLITIVPVFQGITFQPERISFAWTDDWHSAAFRFSADLRRVGSVGTGEVLLLAGPLIIASLRISLHFTEPGTRPDEEREEVSVARYKNIFASYSLDDTSMVEAIHQAYRTLGDESFLDIEALRAGQNWQSALPRAIDSADVFQVFWSLNAAQSTCVYQECRYALQHYKYEGFVRPIYWEKPLKFSPPELSRLPFTYYDMAEKR